MPQIKISCVVSFSSEDKNYPASNLLSNDIVHNRWVGQKGETSNSVVLQLEKSTQLTSVSIGTYHSALVEVLVGRSEASNQPYEVLICASSFMNPADSRNSENISRVRSFSKEQMVPDTQSKKWDRVRVVCTQPYNKHVQYGLSFIQFFISDTLNTSISSASQSNSQTTMLGRFKLRAASSDEDEDKPGELFARFKQKGSLSTDAQIRQAGSPINLNSNKKESNLLVKTARPQKVNKPNDFKVSDNEDTLSRRRDELFYDEKEDGSDKIDRIMKRDRDSKAKLNDSERINEEKKTKTSKPDDSDMSNKNIKMTPKRNSLFDSGKANKKDDKVLKDKFNASVSKDTTRPTKTTSDKDRPDSAKKKDDRKRQHSSDRSEASTSKKQRSKDDEDESAFKDLDITRGPKCLNGVVFVLSGYVNPKRSTLRDAAISLGARYSPDWGPTCTHLVCAFPNTPKHDQVKRLGVQSIVSGKWIEECVVEQAHLPWRWYAMDAQYRISRPKGPLPKVKDKQPAEGRDKKDGSEFSPSKPNPAPGRHAISDSEKDTDDEIERVMKQQQIKEKVQSKVESPKKMPPDKKHENLYDSDSTTDIDEDILKTLPTQMQCVQDPKEDDDLKLCISDDSEDDNNKVKEKATQSSAIKQKDSSFSDNSIDVSIKTLPDVDVGKENLIDLDDLALDEVLPDLFSGIKFYIDPKLSTVKYDVEEVKRYVLAYNGEVLDTWPNKAVDVAITTAKLAEDLRGKKAKKCQFMPPEWVWKCNDTRELFPFERFRIS